MRLKDFSPYSKDQDALETFHFKRNVGTVENPVYVYDAFQEDDANVDIEAGALKILKKRVFDGVAFLAVRADKIQIYWQKDADATPRLIAEAELIGQVWAGGQWQDRTFSFSGANLTKVNADTNNSHYRAFRVEDIPALGIVDAAWGLDLFWQAGNVKFAFYGDPPGQLFRIVWQARVLDNAVERPAVWDNGELISDHQRGLSFSVKDYPGESSHTSGADPEPGWTWHRWVFEPNGVQVPAADGRTPGERFTGTFDENGVQLTERAGLYVDPYLSVAENASYIWVYSDQYIFRFYLASDAYYNLFGIYEHDDFSDTYPIWRAWTGTDTDSHFLGYDENRVTEIIENTPTRVVVRLIGQLDATSGAGTSYLADFDSIELYFYFYQDRFAISLEIIASGTITDNIVLFGMDEETDLTGEVNYYENAGSESASGTEVNRDSADYIAILSDQIDAQFITLGVSGDMNMNQRHGGQGDMLFKQLDSITSGTHNAQMLVILDGHSLYNSTDRLAMGDQYKDTTWDDPTKGAWADDLILPVNVGVDGFAADGADHIDRDANDEAKITFDRVRIRPSQVLHDWPFHTGSIESPTDHLLCHLKLDENAASANLNDETANNADGTWSNVSDGSDRNTNTSGDSVQEIDRGRNLDTQNGAGYIEMVVGSGTVHNIDFIGEGTVIITFKPQFNYDDAADQIIFEIEDGSNENRIRFIYDGAGSDERFEIYLRWNDVAAGAFGAVYTENYSLQREITAMVSWSADNDFAMLAIDGQVIDNLTNTTAPTAIEPNGFSIGAAADRANPADIIIDDVKTLDVAILPYGGIFVDQENDFENPHKTVVAHLKGDEGNSDSLQIGTGTLTVVNATHATDVQGTANAAFLVDGATEYLAIAAANIPTSEGAICLWALCPSSANAYATFLVDPDDYNDFSLNRNNNNTQISWYHNSVLSNMTIPNIWDDRWHYFEFRYSVSAPFRRLFIDGILEYESTTSISALSLTNPTRIGNYVPDADGNFNGRLCDITITNDPLTPQIWTAFGKPLHQPQIIKG